MRLATDLGLNIMGGKIALIVAQTETGHPALFACCEADYPDMVPIWLELNATQRQR